MAREKDQGVVRNRTQTPSLISARGSGVRRRPAVSASAVGMAAAAAAVGVLGAGRAMATGGVYSDSNNGVTTNFWSTSPFWQGGIVPGGSAGDTAFFGGSATGTQTIVVNGTETLGSMTFTNSNTTQNAAPWVLSDGGGSITFDNNGLGATLSYSPGTTGFDDVTIKSTINLNDNLTIFNGQLNKQSIYLTGQINNTTNASTITIGSGSYIVSLNGASDTGTINNFAGSWVVGGGAASTNTTILRLGDDTNLGVGTSSVTLQGPSTQIRYAVTGANNDFVNTDPNRQFFLNATTNTIDVAAGMVLNYNSSKNLVGTGGVTFQDSGTTVFNAQQTGLTGQWRVNGGTVIMNAPFSGAMAVSGAFLDVNAQSTYSSLTFSNAVFGYGAAGALGGQAVSTGTSTLLAVAMSALPGKGDSVTVTPNTALIVQGGLPLTDFSTGTNNVILQPGSIVAESQGGQIANSVSAVPAGVYFGVVGAVTDGNAKVGGANGFLGLSSTPIVNSSLSGTLNAAGDFTMQGPLKTLLLGTTSSGLTVNSTTGSPVNATVTGGTVQSASSANNFSGLNNIYVGDGTNTALLQTANLVNAFTGLQGSIVVNNRGVLDPGSTSTTGGALNAPVHVLAGGELLLNDNNNMNGTGAITLDPGAAVVVGNTNVLGTQHVGGSNLIVRLQNNNHNASLASLLDPTDTIVLAGGGSQLNIGNLNLNAGTLASDTSGRTLNLGTGSSVMVGSNGARFVGVGGTLTVAAPVNAAGQTLTIGSTTPVDTAVNGANLPGNSTVIFSNAVTAGNISQVSGAMQFNSTSSGTISGNIDIVSAPNNTALQINTGNFSVGNGTGTISVHVPTGSTGFADTQFVGSASTPGVTTALINGTYAGNIIIGDNAKMNLTVDGATYSTGTNRLQINQKFTLEGQPAVGNNYNKIYVNSYTGGGGTNVKISLNNIYLAPGSYLAVDRSNDPDVQVSPHLLGDATAYSGYYSGATNQIAANFDFNNITSGDGGAHTLTIAPGPLVTLSNTNGVSSPLIAGIFGTVDGLSTVNVTAGTVTLQPGAALNGSLVANGGNVVVNAPTAGNAGSLAYLGGTLTLNADQSLAAFSVGAGAAYTLANRAVNATSVSVGAGGTLTVDAGGVLTPGTLSGAGTLAVNDGVSVNLGSGAAPVAHAIGSLNLNNTGTVDLGKNSLLTASGNVAAYVARAAGPVQPNGLNAWTGSGLTSSLVQADAATGNTKQLAVGYFDSRDNANTGLSVPAGQTLVKETVYGDATGDGKVNIADLSVWNNNFGVSNPRWSQGDFNYDGKVNIADLSVWNNNFGGHLSGPTPPAGAVAAAASVKLTSSASPSAEAATPPAGTLELDIDPSTGDATLHSGGLGVAAIEIDSASGVLVPGNWKSLKNNYGYTQWAFPRGTPNASQIAEFVSDPSPSGQPANLAAGTVIDYGDIFPVGFTNVADLTFSYNLITDPSQGLTATRVGVIVVPEPTGLALAGVAAAGLLTRKRRRA